MGQMDVEYRYIPLSLKSNSKNLDHCWGEEAQKTWQYHTV